MPLLLLSAIWLSKVIRKIEFRTLVLICRAALGRSRSAALMLAADRALSMAATAAVGMIFGVTVG